MDKKTYIRFGEIPENGKSIAFGRVSKADAAAQKKFWELYDRPGYGYGSACAACIKDGDYLEGVSVFLNLADFETLTLPNAGKELPAVTNMAVADSILRHIGEPVYLVEGTPLDAHGECGEPLLSDIQVIRRVGISDMELIGHVWKSVAGWFRHVEKAAPFPEDKSLWHVETAEYDRWFDPCSGGEISATGQTVDNPALIHPAVKRIWTICGIEFSAPVSEFGFGNNVPVFTYDRPRCPAPVENRDGKYAVVSYRSYGDEYPSPTVSVFKTESEASVYLKDFWTETCTELFKSGAPGLPWVPDTGRTVCGKRDAVITLYDGRWIRFRVVPTTLPVLDGCDYRNPSWDYEDLSWDD